MTPPRARPSIGRFLDRQRRLLLSLAAPSFLTLAMVVATPSQAPGQPTLTLTPQATVVGIAGTMRYQAVLRDSGALPQYLDAVDVSWSSSDDAVLSIDNGIAIGHRPGSATITAKFEGLTAQAPATVAGTVTDHSLVTPDGRTRTYLLYTPSGYSGASPVPVVLTYHGMGGDGRGMMHVTLMNAVADRYGFLVAYPDGLGSSSEPRSWNDGGLDGFAAINNIDDVEFTRRLIDDIAARRNLDPRRVYATGLSNGAKMSQRLGFQLADRIAAIAPVAGALFPGGAFVPGPPARPVSMIQFHGTTDLIAPYDVVADRFNAWRERNQIPANSRLISYRRGIVACETYASFEAVATLCTADPPERVFADGTLYDGGGHAWPGGEKINLSVGGDVPTRHIDASETIWAFFSAFGRLDESGQRLAAAVLPSSRSVSLGASATAFVTIVNPGPAVAAGVAITPAIPSPAVVSFRSTDPVTNLPVGAPNVPVDIPSGEARTFVVSVEPTAPFGPAELVFGFGGPGTMPVTPLRGINTLLMSSETGPVVDAVALVATPAADGILELPGPGQAAAFAVASVNVGAGGPVTALIDTGGTPVPVAMGICRTDPVTSACITAVGPSVSLDMPAGATPTFAIFVVSDVHVAFDPAVNRIFVRFQDVNGTTRGATSVAVRTR